MQIYLLILLFLLSFCVFSTNSENPTSRIAPKAELRILQSLYIPLLKRFFLAGNKAKHNVDSLPVITPRLLSKKKIVTPLPARKVGRIRKKLPYKPKSLAFLKFYPLFRTSASNVAVPESPKEEAAPHNMVDKSLSPPSSPLAVDESSYGNVVKKDMGHQAKGFQRQPETLVNAVEAAVHPGVLKTKSLLSQVQLNSEERRMLSAMPKHPMKFGTARAGRVKLDF